MQIKECKDLNLNKGLNLNLNYSRGVRSFCYFFSTGGWTYTYKALNAANNQLFQTANGARPGVSKVCYKKKEHEITTIFTLNAQVRCPITNLSG